MDSIENRHKAKPLYQPSEPVLEHIKTIIVGVLNFIRACCNGIGTIIMIMINNTYIHRLQTHSKPIALQNHN